MAYKNPPEEARFIAALLELYRGRTWADVLPHAETAWADFGCPDTPWADIETHVRNAWTKHHRE